MSLYQIRKSLGQRIQRARLRNTTFTLISNDCWGAEVYKFLALSWSTPFIGLYLMPDDYLQLLSNPQHYLGSKLEFVQQSRHESVNRSRTTNPFPIGLLGGEIEIQFLHYHSKEEAREKWERRTKRVNWSNLLVKFDGSKDGATPAHAVAFDNLPFRKLTLLKAPQPGIASAVVVPSYNPDGLKQFNASILAFDLVTWLNSGRIERGAFYQLLNKIFVLEN